MNANCLFCRELTNTTALVAVTFSTVSVLADQGGKWVELAPMETARQECGAARIGDNVYVVGGLLANGAVSNAVEVYDISKNQWSFAATMPARRDHMGVAAAYGKLYVIGGYSGDFIATATVFEYKPDTNDWS